MAKDLAALSTASSLAGLAKEDKKQMARDSTFAFFILASALFKSFSFTGSRTSPLTVVLSSTPMRSLAGTRGRGLVTNRLYSSGRFWRPMASRSSNPLVVIKAVLGSLLSSRALVPTVVPCIRLSFWPLWIKPLTPERTALAGFVGEDNILNDFSLPACSKTKSVKVPPVSTPSLIISVVFLLARAQEASPCGQKITWFPWRTRPGTIFFGPQRQGPRKSGNGPAPGCF